MFFLNLGQTQTKTAPGAGGAAAFSNANSVLFTASNTEYATKASPSAEISSGITNQLTASAWVKTSATTGAAVYPIMGSFNSHLATIADGQKWWFGMTGSTGTSGGLRFVSSPNGTTNGATDYGGITINNGQWQHVVVSYNGPGSTVFYINGRQVYSTTSVHSSLYNTSWDFRIGSAVGSTNVNFTWDGNIDEACVFDVALSAAEVRELYNSGQNFDVSTHSQYANCVGWWRMGDGDTHPTLTDQLGYNDLTMVNTVAGDIVSDVQGQQYSRWSVNPVSATSGYFVNYVSTFNYTTSMSAFAWVKNSAATAVETFFSQYDQGTGTGKWNMQYQSGGELQAVVTDSGAQNKIYKTAATYLDGNWHHFGFTWGSSGTFKIYLDGSEVTGGALVIDSNPSFTSLNSVSNDLVLGRKNGVGISNGLNSGYIDQPCVFSVELSASEVAELYNSGATFDLSTHSQSSNLDWWAKCGDDLTNDTASNLQDQVGTNHGQDTGAPVYRPEYKE